MTKCFTGDILCKAFCFTLNNGGLSWLKKIFLLRYFSTSTADFFPKMKKTLLNIISQNGVLAAYKAKLEKIKEEMSGINYTEEMYKIIPLEVPFLTDKDRTESRERNLVLIKK